MPRIEPERFQDLRFGIMVSWDIATVRPGDGLETEMRTHAIGKEWDRRATRFDADAWTRAFKEAGARYVIFVPSHELDFSLSRTVLTDYKSERDYTQEVAEACARHELTFGLYVRLATGDAEGLQSPPVRCQPRGARSSPAGAGKIAGRLSGRMAH